MASSHATIPRRRVDGVLLLDKPVGRSSNAALLHAKWLYAAEKAGHTGTLDPLASGLLPLCFGEATKFAQLLLEARKEYVATVLFGIATATGDAEGEVVAEAPVTFTHAELERVLLGFLGVVEQVPPRHAALKYQGRNYYEYARAGVEIARVARKVSIASIDILDWSPPVATLRVACGKGTYIRVLAEDLGGALGTCAHLRALRRTATGPFTLAGAVTLEGLEVLDRAGRDALLLPAHAPLAELPRLAVDVASARDLLLGKVAPAPAGTSGRYCGFDPCGRFLGLVEVADRGLCAVRLVRTDSVAEG